MQITNYIFNNYDTFLLIWFVAFIPYGIHCLRKRLNDKNNNEVMRKYIEADLQENNLEIQKIEHLSKNKGGSMFSTLDEDIHTDNGLLIISVYSIYKKISVRNISGKQSIYYASIDFKDFHDRKFKRVRWKPDLPTKQ